MESDLVTLAFQFIEAEFGLILMTLFVTSFAYFGGRIAGTKPGSRDWMAVEHLYIYLPGLLAIYTFCIFLSEVALTVVPLGIVLSSGLFWLGYQTSKKQA
ncbi:MAG: hypothetical protein RI919_944 [Actinomycetota bacterium]|jgi:hypothetical protein